MPTALVANAGAAAAGYSIVQTDRGASRTPRYITRFEKQLSGDSQSPHLKVAEGVSDVSQAAADAAALASLNADRDARYGTAAAGGNKGSRKGTALTVDVE